MELPAADSASFSYLVLRKGRWTLFEGSTDRSSWACSPPTTVVVGTAADAPEDVARNALAWHAKPRTAKVDLDD